MTERIRGLIVRAFRGVPGELAVDFEEGRSLVALGDNGTGKSSIADALEFYFTGQIRFLAREGRTIIHHQSADADDAVIEIDTTGSLGGTATVRHAVEAAREVGHRETFLLSGRTLADFVDKTKGEKWRYLFEILGLGAIDQLRRDLQTARNALEGERSQARGHLETAARALRARCPDLTDEGLWEAVEESYRPDQCVLARQLGVGQVVRVGDQGGHGPVEAQQQEVHTRLDLGEELVELLAEPAHPDRLDPA